MASLLTFLILAHGRYPVAYQIHETPTRQTQLAAGTTFGLLLSDDDGQTWQWVCEEAVGYGGTLSPIWWVGTQGRLLAGTFRGLFASSDRGCTWGAHPVFGELPDGGQGTGVSDLHGSATALFATSGKYGVVNHVWRSTNEGTDWTPLSPMSNGEFYTTVRTAPSRPQRVYVAAWWFRPVATEYLYVSDDNGDSFTRVDVTNNMPIVPIADGGMGIARGSFYVHAVDPTTPDRLWATLQQDEGTYRSYLLESNDRGQTWTMRLDTTEQLTSVVVSEDGQTVWAASSARLYRSMTTPASFTPLERPTRQSCASRFGDRFYTCGWPEVDQFAAAREAEDAGWSPVLTWERVTAVASCPASSPVTTQCVGFFPALLASFPKAGNPDGGVGGGAGGAGGGSGGGGGGGGDMPPRGCSCSLSGAEVSLTLLLLALRFAPLYGLRRRRIHR